MKKNQECLYWIFYSLSVLSIYLLSHSYLFGWGVKAFGELDTQVFSVFMFVVLSIFGVFFSKPISQKTIFLNIGIIILFVFTEATIYYLFVRFSFDNFLLAYGGFRYNMSFAISLLCLTAFLFCLRPYLFNIRFRKSLDFHTVKKPLIFHFVRYDTGLVAVLLVLKEVLELFVRGQMREILIYIQYSLLYGILPFILLSGIYYGIISRSFIAEGPRAPPPRS